MRIHLSNLSYEDIKTIHSMASKEFARIPEFLSDEERETFRVMCVVAAMNTYRPK